MSEFTLFVLHVADDDWVSLAEFVQLVEEKFPTDLSDPFKVRERALALLEEMLHNKLLDVGNLAPRFTSWKMTPTEAMERIRQVEWPRAGTALSPFGGCWFQITPGGERIVQGYPDQSPLELG